MQEVNMHRCVSLTGAESVAIIMLAKIFQKLKAESPQRGQEYLASVWMDWRRQEGDVKEVTKGIGTFFDLYFATFGDFARIEATVLGAIPKQFQAMANQEAENLAKENMDKFRGFTQKFEVGGFAIPDVPASERN